GEDHDAEGLVHAYILATCGASSGGGRWRAPTDPVFGAVLVGAGHRVVAIGSIVAVVADAPAVMPRTGEGVSATLLASID
ncbi:MAG: hypothetical protein ACJ76K_08745, partial [Solirubrobacteraceae bacterium]